MGMKTANTGTDEQIIEAGTETEINDDTAEQGEEGERQLDPESGAEAEEGDESGDGGEDAGEVVVSIGDETPPAEEDDNKAPEWVRELRKSSREKDRKLRELEQENARLKGSTTTQPAAVVVGEKPTLEGCDFDAEKFGEQLEAWHESKRAADEQQRQAQQAEQSARDAWNKKLTAYGAAKAALKVKDFDDAESAAKDVLTITQQGVIVHGAKNPALLIYALGKNSKKAKELAAITDPVKFAFAAAELELQLKVTPRKTAPAPDRTVSGSVAGAAAVDNQLEKLRAEAAKTGDNSKVIAFRRQQQAREKA